MNALEINLQLRLLGFLGFRFILLLFLLGLGFWFSLFLGFSLFWLGLFRFGLFGLSLWWRSGLGGTRLFHFLQCLGQLASATVFFVILRSQVNIKHIHLLITTTPGKGDHFSIRRPARLVFIIRMARQVKRLLTAINGAQPDIAIKIIVRDRVHNPLAVRAPVILRGVPALKHTLRLVRLGVHHPEIAALL